MASYSTNEFKSGLKIILDGEPYNIVDNEFVKPGKGQAFNRVKVRNLKTGRVVERTFRSGESVEAADIFEKGKKSRKDMEATVDELYRQIGRLKVERDF